MLTHEFELQVGKFMLNLLGLYLFNMLLSPLLNTRETQSWFCKMINLIMLLKFLIVANTFSV